MIQRKPIPLRVQLMGRPVLIQDGEHVPGLKTHHLEALVGGLLLEPGRRLSRDALAWRLWPAQDEPTRRRNLRQLVYRLRAAWSDSDRWILAERDELAWRSGGDCQVDIDRIELLIRDAPSAAVIEELCALNTGPLMDGHDERWILPRRRDFTLGLADYFRRTAGWAGEQGDDTLLVRCLELLVCVVPAEEEAWRNLARAYARVGDMAGLRDAKSRYERILPMTLRKAVLPETLSLFQQLLAAPPVPTVRIPLPGVVGREKERAQLYRAWTRAQEGVASLAVVRGGTGIGKSTMINAFRAQVAGQGCETLPVTCYEGGAGAPFAAVARLLDATVLEELPTSWMVELSRLRPSIRESHPALPLPEPLTTPLHHQTLMRTLEQVLLRHQPMLIVVDDAQWCDRESLVMLSSLLFQCPSARVMVILAVNTMTAAAHRADFDRLLTELARRQAGSEISLGPLAPETLREVVRLHATRPIAETLIEALCEESEGNPLCLLSLLRGERACAETALENVALYRRYLYWQVSGFAAAVVEVAELAAVLGRRFQMRTLCDLLPADTQKGAAVATLIAAGYLREDRNGNLEWTSRHTHQAVYEPLGQIRRSQIHASAAGSTFRTIPPSAEQSLAIIRHLESRARRDISAPRLLEAASQCRDAGALETASLLFALALERLETAHLIPC